MATSKYRTQLEQLPLRWLIRLRWVAILGQLGILAFASIVLSIELSLPLLLLVVSFTAISNLILETSWGRSAVDSPGGLAFILFQDTIALTVLLALSGGAANPFSIFYLVHVVLSSVLLGTGWTWCMAVLSSICFGSLFFLGGESHGSMAHMHEMSSAAHLHGMWFAFTVGAMVVASFVAKISSALRDRDFEIERMSERQGRLAALTTLAAGAAHELATPLSSIAIAASELERMSDASGKNHEIQEDLRLIRVQVQRCKEILSQMRGTSGNLVEESPTPIAPTELANEVARSFNGELSRISIECNALSQKIMLPKGGLFYSLRALIKNALEASDPEQSVKLVVSGNGEALSFSVHDSGCGIKSESLSRVGEPFFTTKPPGKGMGLGVFLVRLFGERCGGTLQYESSPGKGTVATLILPASEALI